MDLDPQEILNEVFHFSHLGGLARPEDVSYITSRRPVCTHIVRNWDLYSTVTMKWQAIALLNEPEDTSPLRVLNRVAGVILDQDVETRILDLSEAADGVEAEDLAKKIALVCMLGPTASAFDFPKVFEDRCKL